MQKASSPSPPSLSLLPSLLISIIFIAECSEKEKVEKLWMCSYSCLSRGLELYDEADGTTALNRAITYANMGCLARACASVHTQLAEAKGAEFSSEEKTYYEKSLKYYTTAQQVNTCYLYVQYVSTCVNAL